MNCSTERAWMWMKLLKDFSSVPLQKFQLVTTFSLITNIKKRYQTGMSYTNKTLFYTALLAEVPSGRPNQKPLKNTMCIPSQEVDCKTQIRGHFLHQKVHFFVWETIFFSFKIQWHRAYSHYFQLQRKLWHHIPINPGEFFSFPTMG